MPKISELTALSSLDSADLFVVVHGGATYKVPYSVFSAGLLLLGLRQGIEATIKDADEIYISGGCINIAGMVYVVTANLTKTITIGVETALYLYVNSPSSGITLSATEFTTSTTAPAFNHTYGADYMTGDATKRYVATLHITASVITQISQPRTPKIAYDADNVLNNNDIIVYDATLGALKGIAGSAARAIIASEQSHIADASTTHAITDPGDSPVDADALRDDLVTNTIPAIETALNDLGTKINAILAAIEANNIMATS